MDASAVGGGSVGTAIVSEVSCMGSLAMSADCDIEDCPGGSVCRVPGGTVSAGMLS